jgi:uncharacterized protein (DUF1778 family)
MKKEKTFNFRIHNEILEYLKLAADKNFTTITGYIMELIKKDMEKNVINKRS